MQALASQLHVLFVYLAYTIIYGLSGKHYSVLSFLA